MRVNFSISGNGYCELKIDDLFIKGGDDEQLKSNGFCVIHSCEISADVLRKAKKVEYYIGFTTSSNGFSFKGSGKSFIKSMTNCKVDCGDMLRINRKQRFISPLGGWEWESKLKYIHGNVDVLKPLAI